MTGKIILGGKEHDVSVIDGKRFIDGEPIDDFIDKCDPLLLCELAQIGKLAIQDEIKGTKRSYQSIADGFYISRN